MSELYCFSGISGAGKSTIGQKVIDSGLIPNAVLVDQDSFYLKAKPTKKLADGRTVSNWDCMEALDSGFTNSIAELLMKNNVVLVGFALTADILPIQAKVHVHLVTAKNPVDLAARCQIARRQAKPNLNTERD